ncbi:hypothetical protein AAVH_21923 [Aphelenchoides avenae]|nr:hypothetical protein AAVH_21923 [Aphelenchus avenae]
MAFTLIPSAVHQIIFLLENDDLPTADDEYKRAYDLRWRVIDQLYKDVTPAPPLDYLGSRELALFLKGDVDDEDIRAIFEQGKPLQFWDCPQLLVSKILATFNKQQKELVYLDITITALPGFNASRPSESWPKAYSQHLPAMRVPRSRPSSVEAFPTGGSDAGKVHVLVEKFHISSASYGQRLTVELHYQLVEEGTSSRKSDFVQKIMIRVTNETCTAKEHQPASADRKR